MLINTVLLLRRPSNQVLFKINLSRQTQWRNLSRIKREYKILDNETATLRWSNAVYYGPVCEQSTCKLKVSTCTWLQKHCTWVIWLQRGFREMSCLQDPQFNTWHGVRKTDNNTYANIPNLFSWVVDQLRAYEGLRLSNIPLGLEVPWYHHGRASKLRKCSFTVKQKQKTSNKQNLHIYSVWYLLFKWACFGSMGGNQTTERKHTPTLGTLANS